MRARDEVGAVTAEQRARQRHKERVKLVRGTLEYLAVAVLIFLAVRGLVLRQSYVEAAGTTAGETVPDGRVYTASGTGEGDGFIAVSYAGLTTIRETNLVYQGDYEEQMDALAMNGFHTISQAQALQYMRQGGALPARALTLLFEDGISDTTHLAQAALMRNNFLATVSTYGMNLADVASRYLTTSDVKALESSSYWELACAGWRLSYINVFDRWGNSFGPLNMNEYLAVRPYLKRDYNHYLMDFLRDEDRMRRESVAEMRTRLAADYELMRAAYTKGFGSLPPVSVLMHANTGMFGTDALASAENERQLSMLFAVNYNRMGSCLNDLSASPYDLTRMQVQPYWSTNCMLMHILDDTGRPVTFVQGDEQSDWELLSGALQRRGNELILTSETLGAGRAVLRRARTADLTLRATLKGNVYGRQAVYLRCDRRGEGGVCVALEHGELSVTEGDAALLTLSLLDFDGGPTQSVEENELEGLIACQLAVIQYDDDALRRETAAETLKTLQSLHARTIAEGAEPYIPAIDVADRGERQLELRLSGSELTVLLDGRVVAEKLPVTVQGRGSVVLEAVPRVPDEYSQRNVYEDVYDARFVDLMVSDGEGVLLSDMTLEPAAQTLQGVRNVWDKVVAFVMDTF